MCTPAGRKIYLEILSRYLLDNPLVTEWHLWQNCREESDRKYIYELASRHQKVKIIELTGVDGTNRSVNKFYKYCNEPDTFYIKMDDDIVYIHSGAIRSLVDVATEERGKYLYWSPLVINNAICTAILSARGLISTEAPISAQAGDRISWKSPLFAKNLHEEFLSIAEDGRVDDFLSDYRLHLGAQRFSINCIGFWGDSVLRLGEQFCPTTVDDEEWISAVLPMRLGLSGRVVGMSLVSHYSFYTQEWYLNKTMDLLGRYAQLAGVEGRHAILKDPFRRRLSHFGVIKGFAVDYVNNVLGIYKGSQKEKFKISFERKNEC